MQDVPQRRIELTPWGSERSTSDGQVNERGIGHVVRRVFGEPPVEEDLRVSRVRPHEAHVYCFRALHRNQGRHLAALRRRAIGVGIREQSLRGGARPETETQERSTAGADHFLVHR